MGRIIGEVRSKTCRRNPKVKTDFRVRVFSREAKTIGPGKLPQAIFERMMRGLLVFGWLGVLIAGAQVGEPRTPDRQVPPPAWGTSARIERIRALLPQLDALYEAHAASNHIPGHVWGLVVDGRLLHLRASGLARVEPAQGVAPDTRFRIASMSKSLTAAAILQLRDQGKLSLEDPVSKHLPEFRTVRPATPDSPPLTLRHLLRMSGGFPQDDPWGDRKLSEPDTQLDALVARGLTPASPTGTRWEYSNLGYAVLGRVVTRVAKEPYQAYITRRILKPLGMTNSVYGPRRSAGAGIPMGGRALETRTDAARRQLGSHGGTDHHSRGFRPLCGLPSRRLAAARGCRDRPAASFHAA